MVPLGVEASCYNRIVELSVCIIFDCLPLTQAYVQALVISGAVIGPIGVDERSWRLLNLIMLDNAMICVTMLGASFMHLS